MRRDLQLKDTEGVDCLPNATIFEQLTLMEYEKLSQKLTFYKAFFSPQWKFLIQMILQCLNDAINEEMDDSLVRTATTASSLEAEQDSGGPRRQDTIGDTIVETRFENVFKTSNDSLFVGVNTPRSNEDRLQLKELIELCTNLQQRVLDLENAKTAQAQEITNLKLRVKRLEKKRGSRIYKLKRLYRVGSSRRVESSEDEDDTQERYGDDMFDTGVLDDEEVFKGYDVDETRNVAKKEVSTTDPVTTAGEVVTIASVEVPVISDQGTTTTTLSTTTIAATIIIAASTRSNAKGIVIQEQVQAPTPIKISKKDQIMLDEEEEERLAREKAQQVEEANISWDNMQAMIDVDYQMAQRLQAQEQEKLNIQKLFDKAMTRVNTFVDMDTELVEESSKKAKAEESSSKRAGDELEPEVAKKQKMDKDKETAEL
ncbi:hypothetical protein Tco_0436715 [Tanacetum coccineum]